MKDWIALPVGCAVMLKDIVAKLLIRMPMQKETAVQLVVCVAMQKGWSA